MDSRLIQVRPTPRQVAWQTMEFYAFVHFGMNTMTNREWGDGTESPALFDPAQLDADQWVSAIAAAGMTGVILTTKHHDGFCLWPTATTDHSVAGSPWRGGGGDVVGDVAAACARHGLRFGVYLSPWDRHEPRYGTGTAYDDFYIAQLTELLTRYGPMFTLWMDGAQSPSLDPRQQPYDWERIFSTARALQPDAVLSSCGPDVRWCGNEAGVTRSDEWSVVPASLRDTARIAERSQHEDQPGFGRIIYPEDLDLGSRAAVAGREDDLVWYPAEVDVSIRPGWFHHPEENDRVRTPDNLFDLYLGAVGGNATLLLNVPPDRSGLVSDADVASLHALGDRIRALRAGRIRCGVEVSSGTLTTPESRLADGLGGVEPWWRPDPGDAQPTLRLALPRPTPLSALVLKEAIREGQRVEQVDVEFLRDGVTVDRRTTGAIGYQRIVRLEGIDADAVRLRFTRSRGPVVLAGTGLVAA